MKIKFIERIQLNLDIISLSFEKPTGYNYLAGQYAEINFIDEKVDSIGDNRWFTLSSSPSESVITITTRLNKPLSKFKNKFVNLKAGDEVLISEPIGDFVLPIDKTIPLVFISGGIGITPVRSIIKWLLDNKEQREITIERIVRSEKDLVFNDLFLKYKMKYRHYINTTNTPLSSIFDLTKFSSNSLFFISGTQELVEHFTESLSVLYGRQSIIMDYFPGYTSI